MCPRASLIPRGLYINSSGTQTSQEGFKGHASVTVHSWGSSVKRFSGMQSALGLNFLLISKLKQTANGSVASPPTGSPDADAAADPVLNQNSMQQGGKGADGRGQNFTCYPPEPFCSRCLDCGQRVIKHRPQETHLAGRPLGLVHIYIVLNASLS